MKRIMLIVAYDGTNYSGWQVQPNADFHPRKCDCVKTYEYRIYTGRMGPPAYPLHLAPLRPAGHRGHEAREHWLTWE